MDISPASTPAGAGGINVFDSPGSLSDWFAGQTASSSFLTKYSSFDGDEDAESLQFSLDRLSFPSSATRSQDLEGEFSGGDRDMDGSRRKGRKQQSKSAKLNARERSMQYSNSLRKKRLPRIESARDKRRGKHADLQHLGHDSENLSRPDSSVGPLRNANKELEDSLLGLDGGSLSLLGLKDPSVLTGGLLAIGNDSLTSINLDGGPLSSKSQVENTSSRRSSSASRKLSNSHNNISGLSINPSTRMMSGVEENSQVWSVGEESSTENTPNKSLLKLKVSTPLGSSLEPWLENEAKRENEAMLIDMEDELRYKIRALAVEYDRLQFKALENEEVITTQQATVRLKTKMHEKDLKQREVLLEKERKIKEMIKKQEEDKFVIVARRMVYKHILQRAARLHVETYKKVQVIEKEVEEYEEACKVAKKKQIMKKTEVNAAKIKKFKWLARQEEETKRKRKMIKFRRGELSKLRNQSKKLGLVSDSQIVTTSLLGLINTVQGAQGESDKPSEGNEAVDKQQSTMMQLHKLYQVTDTTDSDGVIAVWNRSVEGLEALKRDRDNTIAKLEELNAEKNALIEDLELLHLTGRGIFTEKNQEVRSITLQSSLDQSLKDLKLKSKTLSKKKNELLVIYQGVMNMLRKMKGNAGPELAVFNENVLGALRQPLNADLSGSVASDPDTQDVTTLFKHFEECLMMLNRLVNQKNNLSMSNQV